ncbi:hypothetical protein [Microbacterium sp. bgisy189]|uniref:hypothetical protein n=1 Tax=Microbacterium sp. bgisy189 TaxID=3413798 RepID=UPI003EB8C3AB
MVKPALRAETVAYSGFLARTITEIAHPLGRAVNVFPTRGVPETVTVPFVATLGVAEVAARMTSSSARLPATTTTIRLSLERVADPGAADDARPADMERGDRAAPVVPSPLGSRT